MTGSKLKLRLVVVGVVLAAFAAVAIYLGKTHRGSTAPPPPAPALAASGPRVLATLPEFVLADEQGRSVDLYDLHGTVWIAGFIFTRCDSICPLITAQMADLQRELAADPAAKAVRLVSFTVDPEVDTPEVLQAYARQHGADPARWSFLTGTRPAVRDLITQGFKLPVTDQPGATTPIVHSQSLALIDGDGRVRGVWDALTDDGRKQLRAGLAAVLGEAGPRAAAGGDVYVPRDVASPPWLEPDRAAQVAGAAAITARHDFAFTDRVGASGITFHHVSSTDSGAFYRATHYDHGTAVAAADVDGDGRPDLYFVNQDGPNALFRNLGGGRFEDITARAKVAVGDRACVGASFADVDNDGDADLFVTSVRRGNLMFENDGHGAFTDVTDKAGLAGNEGHASGAVFFDYDDDGRLDLFVTDVGRYTSDEKRADGLFASLADAFAGHLHEDRFELSQLFHNLGGGRFEHVSVQARLVHSAWSGEAAPFDYDEDGHTDLYVLSMQGHDELWRNQGDGHFEQVSRKVFPATPWGAMGAKVLDWNGDGHLDLYVTDMHTDMASELAPADDKKKHDLAKMFPPRFLATDGNHVLGNALFTARGAGAFDERSDAANVETGWPWGPSAGDLNADGWPDLFVTGGMCYPFRYRGNDVLLNEHGTRFASAEYVLGVEPRQRIVRPWFDLDCDGADAGQDLCKGEGGPVLIDDTRDAQARGKGAPRKGAVTVWASRGSRSSVILDLDDDGDLDIVTNNYNDVPQVFISDLAARGPVHRVNVRLTGAGANRDALGAVVTVVAAGRAQVQLNDGKSGYLGQSSLPLYVGLGEADHADEVRVRWPGGKVQTVRGPFKSGTTIAIAQAK